MNSKIDEFVVLLGLDKRPFVICGETGVGKKHGAKQVFSARGISERFHYAIDCGAFSTEESISKVDSWFEQNENVGLIVDGLEFASKRLQSYLCEQLESLKRGNSQKRRHIACLLDSPEPESVRKDLWYMVSSTLIEIPPLRKRREDIDFLSEVRLTNISARWNHGFIETLHDYSWPGNMDELFCIIDGAVLRANGSPLAREHLPEHLRQVDTEAPALIGVSLKELLVEYEKGIIIEALKQSNGNKSRAARLLQISERIIGLRCTSLDINPKQYKQPFYT